MFDRIVDLAELVGSVVIDAGKVGCAAVEEVVDVVVDNPFKSAAVVAGGVFTGGVGFVYAPAVGALVSSAGFGVAGGTLSGAVSSSAGLAALGGGSIASGGLGMAGGTAVVTGVGSATGAAVSSFVPGQSNH